MLRQEQDGLQEKAYEWQSECQLSYLPTEVFEIILPNVGGYAFVSLRRTCKRIKMIVDDLEMRLSPCIWYRYMLSDFSKGCIASVIPWLKKDVGQLRENIFHWKMIYAGVQSSLKKHRVFTTKRVQFNTGYGNVINISFAGSQLFVNYACDFVLCVGLRARLQPESILPITDLRYKANDGSAEICCLEINHATFKGKVVYKPFAIADQANSIVQGCRTLMETNAQHFADAFGIDECKSRCDYKYTAAPGAVEFLMQHVRGLMPHRTRTILQCYNEVLICAFGKTVVFCNHLPDGQDPEFVCSETELVHTVKSIHKLGDLLVFIVHDAFNNVFTNTMRVDGRGKIQVGAWNRLYLPTAAAGQETGETGEMVCDADVLGNSLVLVTDLGKVYLGSTQDTSHTAIQRKLYLAHEIERALPGANYYVSLDLNNGLVIAILEERTNQKEIILLFDE